MLVLTQMESEGLSREGVDRGGGQWWQQSLKTYASHGSIKKGNRLSEILLHGLKVCHDDQPQTIPCYYQPHCSHNAMDAIDYDRSNCRQAQNDDND